MMLKWIVSIKIKGSAGENVKTPEKITSQIFEPRRS